MNSPRPRVSKQADWAWLCPCGRTVHGNGGQSGHRKACRVYKAHRLVALNRALDAMAAGQWGIGMAPILIERWQHQYELERDLLVKELA